MYDLHSVGYSFRQSRRSLRYILNILFIIDVFLRRDTIERVYAFKFQTVRIYPNRGAEWLKLKPNRFGHGIL